MKQALAAFILAVNLPFSSLSAQEYVETAGPLSNADFYRLIACAAPPDQPCQKPFVRWQDARQIKLWVAPLSKAYLGAKTPRAKAAISRAINALNSVNAGLFVRQTSDRSSANIKLFFLNQKRGEMIAGTGEDWVDGARLGGATTRLAFDAKTGFIQDGYILISRDLGLHSYEGAILEELTQALGLMTDIKNPAYEGVSIFSQVGNQVTKLSPQDRYVLQRHYPRK